MSKKLLEKLPVSKPLWGILIFNLIIIIAVFLTRGFLPPVVPLFYGFPKGADQLAPSVALTIPPTIAIIVTLVCVVLITIFKDEFLKKILLATSIVVSILSFVTVLKIILLVGSF